MDYICSFLWITLEVLCLFYTCSSFFAVKHSKITTWGVVIVAMILFYLLSTTDIQVFINYPLSKKIVALLLCIAFSLVVFNGQWYMHFIVVILFYLLLGAIDTLFIYGASFFLGLPVSALIWKKWLYTIIVTAGKSLFLFSSWILYKTSKKRKIRKYNRKKLVLTILYPAVSVVMLFMVFDNYKNQSDLSLSAIFFSAILIVSNFAVVFLSDSLERMTQAEQEITILNQSMNLQVDNYNSLVKSYRAQRSATHEFKHQLQVIFDLLETGKEDQAKKYIRDLQSLHSSRIFVSNTNHAIVDAILNEKYHKAKEDKIEVHYKVNDLSTLSLNSDSIVVLLSNLLDNAIEATRQLSDNRKIECTIILEDSLFLSVRNTSPPVEIINGIIESNKEPKEEHGYGLLGVKRVLKDLGAEYVIDYSSGWFSFATEIPSKH